MEKIAGRMRPALVDPVHNSHQGRHLIRGLRSTFFGGFFKCYFTLFRPRNGLHTIREHVWTSGLVLVGF